MRGLAKFLERSGFDVLNLNYPSTRHDLEALAGLIHPRIAEFVSAGSGKVHFVGHSMGGLLIRAYLRKHRPVRLGRVVMVGTPNGGSEVADLLKDFFFYRKLYGPAGQQLVTDQQSFAHILGGIDFELGVIAGNRSIDPISSRIIGKPNDGKVSIESVYVKGASDTITLPANHAFFPSNRRMWTQTLHFLTTGRFAVENAS